MAIIFTFTVTKEVNTVIIFWKNFTFLWRKECHGKKFKHWIFCEKKYHKKFSVQPKMFVYFRSECFVPWDWYSCYRHHTTVSKEFWENGWGQQGGNYDFVHSIWKSFCDNYHLQHKEPFQQLFEGPLGGLLKG